MGTENNFHRALDNHYSEALGARRHTASPSTDVSPKVFLTLVRSLSSVAATQVNSWVTAEWGVGLAIAGRATTS
jgi:hypothetical protein